VSAGAPDNFAPGASGAATVPRVPPIVTTAETPRGPRFRVGRLRNAIFIVLLTFLSVISIYPLVWLVSASFKPQQDIYDNKLIPQIWQWNYDDVFDRAPVLTWMWNSVWLSVLAAAAVTISSAAVAFAFAYFRFPGRSVLFGLILATMMLPGAVTMIPVYLIWNEIGKFTMEHAWLPHIGVNTQYPLWVPNLFGSAFYIFLIRQFMLGIPRELFEAARIDGDNFFTLFWRMAVPLTKPALMVAFIFEIQAKWFDLMTPLIYLRDEALFTMPLGLKTILDSFGLGGGGEGEFHIIVAATVLTVIPMIVLFAIFQRYFIEGAVTQGRKG
jgi:multiple sugar transport system permease protein